MKTIVRTQSYQHHTWLCSGMILTALFWFATVGSAAESIWTKKTDMITPRYAMGTAVADGKIYTIGGTIGPGNAGVSTLEVYDPAADTWTRKADMPTRRTFLSACAANGKIYALGGVRSVGQHWLATVEEYDPHSDTWRELTNMPTERAGLCAVAVDGIVYAIGGVRTTLEIVKTVEAYDPATDTWTRKADMPTTRRTFLSASVVDGKIYVLGGAGPTWGSQPVKIVEVYDPTTDTWTRRANMPVAKYAHASSAVGSVIFTIGGQYAAGSTGNTSVEAYDTVTDTWSTFADMPTARDALSTATVDWKIYAMGGRFSHPGTLALSAVEEFDPFPLIIDFNGDEIVDAKDFCCLAQYWCEDEPSVDVAPEPFGDGVVDHQDLAVLSEHWLKEVLPDSLIAYWKLDETEGFVAHDSAGDHNAFVLADNPLWRPTRGTVNGALEVDGIDDFVSVPFILNPADGPFSVFAWVRGGAPGQVVMSQIGAANWLMADPTAGALMTELKGAGRFGQPLITDAVIIDGDWHCVGLTWDGSNRVLYVDDAAVAMDPQSSLAGLDGGLYIGAGKDRDPASFFSGLIDDVRIYNRAVTP